MLLWATWNPQYRSMNPDGGVFPKVLTQRRLVQKVKLRVEVVHVWIVFLDDVCNEVQQRLLPVGRFGV